MEVIKPWKTQHKVSNTTQKSKPLEIVDGAIQVGKGTIELRLEHRREPFPELPGRLVAQRDEMTAHEYRLGGGGGDAQLFGAFRQPSEICAIRCVVQHFRQTSLVIRLRHAQEPIDAHDLQREPPDGAIPRL